MLHLKPSGFSCSIAPDTKHINTVGETGDIASGFEGAAIELLTEEVHYSICDIHLKKTLTLVTHPNRSYRHR